MYNLILYGSSLLCALVLVAGGIAFLFRQKTVVDAEGNVTHVEIPIFGKIRSNYPFGGHLLHRRGARRLYHLAGRSAA